MHTPVSFKNHNMPKEQLHSFMEEWSLTQAERNHVETIEEANDFEIHDEEDSDFFEKQTVYEMHEMAEENLAIYKQNQELQAESNETVVPGGDNHNPLHDQSAPDEPNPPENPLPD